MTTDILQPLQWNGLKEEEEENEPGGGRDGRHKPDGRNQKTTTSEKHSCQKLLSN